MRRASSSSHQRERRVPPANNRQASRAPSLQNLMVATSNASAPNAHNMPSGSSAPQTTVLDQMLAELFPASATQSNDQVALAMQPLQLALCSGDPQRIASAWEVAVPAMEAHAALIQHPLLLTRRSSSRCSD